MIKISHMAKLAQTTRRTLIFYDQKNIFKPAFKNRLGYRYYDYDQLYNLLFILELRSLNIPLNKIKQINNKSKLFPMNTLINIQNKIDKKINHLVRVQKIINKKINTENIKNNKIFYKPMVQKMGKEIFWCSKQSVNCTKKEVAQLFSEFYKQLKPLTLINANKSGFLTNLSLNNPNSYSNASFRIIKETNINHQQNSEIIPVIPKKSNRYVTIHVENNISGIHKGLIKLKHFCQKNNLKTSNYLWQINDDNPLIKTGASKYGWLEFNIVNN
ncbi:hypothetical protein WR164_13880 [Philodulcilactobacillus myokoensis]|uniref:HTH merR-type domain-containing protein n=1 Tax=Philodulcilactobacillus myokoensis TaxID=2929573 RepID=A0A9W6EU76_9LACO|nr:MerR family transcriptional regulator [Philodulcilactobacillus myokoensis]GLB47409.1 hypothetical protein WR164_13880 [Philodulcilactobacillus myokoensis]